MDRLREIGQEFRTVVMGRSNLIDAIAPPLLFVLIHAVFGFDAALWSSLVVAGAITVLRLARGQPLWYALGGVGGVGVAILLAILLGRAEGYFVPAIVSSAATALVCLVSVVLRRPLVALTSHLARRWPLAWYGHPRVRPAYSEVTLAWAVFFGLRLALQWALFQSRAPGLLATANVVMGWPATAVLLIGSYVYGTWRLRNLGGPGVDEFESGAEPPWQGQQRGF